MHPPIKTYLRSVERLSVPTRLSELADLPTPMTWSRYRRHRALGWRMLTAGDLRTSFIVQVDDFVGVVTQLSCTYAWHMEPIRASWDSYIPKSIEPEQRVAKVLVSVVAERRGFVCHYEATLAPDWPIMVYMK